MRTLLGIVAVLTLFSSAASAQETVCYMEWGGQVIDLSRLCTHRTQEKSNVSTVSNFRVSDVQIAPTGDGTSLEIRGTIINESSKATSLSAVQFNVIDQSGRIVARDSAVVEAGAGLAPGQQLAFLKVISKEALGGNANISNLRVEITGSV